MEHFTHYTTGLSIELSLNQVCSPPLRTLVQVTQGARLDLGNFFIQINLKLVSPLHTVHTERVKYIDYWPVFPEHRQYLLICMCLCFFFGPLGGEGSINRQLWRRRNYNDLLASFSRDRGVQPYKSSKVTAIAGTNPS